MHLFVTSFTAPWYFPCVLNGSPRHSESLLSCSGVEENFVFLIHRQSFIFLLFRSLPHLFFIYILFLSPLLLFSLRTVWLHSRLPAYLFFMRKLDQGKHCSCWRKGCEERCVHPTFVKHFTSFAFISSRCFGVTSILLYAVHHLNSF